MNVSMSFVFFVMAFVATHAIPAYAQYPVAPILEPVYYPRHQQGDAEFDGNGPDVSWSVTLFVNPDNCHEVVARVWMNAVEPRGDRTTAFGWQDFVVARSPQPINGIVGNAYVEGHYVDYDVAVDLFPNPGSYVREVRITGDTRGDDVGVSTRIEVVFNTIIVN